MLSIEKLTFWTTLYALETFFKRFIYHAKYYLYYFVCDGTYFTYHLLNICFVLPRVSKIQQMSRNTDMTLDSKVNIKYI